MHGGLRVVTWHAGKRVVIVVSATNRRAGSCNTLCVSWWRLVTWRAFGVAVDTVSVVVNVLFGRCGGVGGNVACWQHAFVVSTKHGAGGVPRTLSGSPPRLLPCLCL